MNIVMFTNTFTPHIGGVARSVSWLVEDLRDRGHGVLVVAPEFPDRPRREDGVLRVAALQKFRGSDFSVPIPLPGALDDALDAFAPDIVHSHHPFLLGDTALRTAAQRGLPVVYTYHTRYELYGHYVAEDAPALRRLVLSLALGYCDLCDAVIAPSRSMAEFLSLNGVAVPVSVIPTGIDPDRFAGGDGARVRADCAIPARSTVVGHVGRLAPEKNLDYLAEAAKRFLLLDEEAHFLVAGQGAAGDAIRRVFEAAGLSRRLHLLGAVEGGRLADAYAAMDVFAFSSVSETQGLVLAEAMAAGLPVVALDAPGAREIVRDRRNGRLLPQTAPAADFADALSWIAGRTAEQRRGLRDAAKKTAARFSRSVTTGRTMALYHQLLGKYPAEKRLGDSPWETAMRRLDKEWGILRNLAHAVGEAVQLPDHPPWIREEPASPSP